MRVAGIGTMGILLPGCAALEGLDRGLYDAHRSVTQEDLITGQRIVGFDTRAEQIEEGNTAMEQIVRSYDHMNETVDHRSYTRLLHIFERVHAVSHFAHEKWDVLLLPEFRPLFDALSRMGFYNLPAEIRELQPHTGGTRIAVFQGLMEKVQDDAAVAAVIGHEIGHVTANHVFEQQQLMIALVERALEKEPGAGAGFAYSTLNENEADKIGVVYTALAGYDPYSVSDLWGRLARQYKDDWSWFRTHPASSDRARTTRDGRQGETILPSRSHGPLSLGSV